MSTRSNKSWLKNELKTENIISLVSPQEHLLKSDNDRTDQQLSRAYINVCCSRMVLSDVEICELVRKFHFYVKLVSKREHFCAFLIARKKIHETHSLLNIPKRCCFG